MPMRSDEQLFKPLRDWFIHERDEHIPKKLKFPNWQTSRILVDETPLMMWIVYRRDYPIPNELKYTNWQTDRDS